jgi:hypothetical protein
MNAHFFDLNTAIVVESEVWIVSKKNPNQPLVKISQSEFNLIRKSIFRNKGELIKIEGVDYWIGPELFEKIKSRCKSLSVEITNLAFSMQEFMKPDIIKSLDYKIWKEHFISLKNSDDDIYFICSKNTKSNYEYLIDKLETFLSDELGLKIKNYYFISETFYNRDEDKTAHKKVRLLLQHLVGYKTNGDLFTDEELPKYDKIYFYDDEIKTLNLATSINDVLRFLLSNTEVELKKSIESLIKSQDICLDIRSVTYNKVNMFTSKEVVLSLDRIMKTYERFINRF